MISPSSTTDRPADPVEAQHVGVSQVLVARFERVAQGSARRAAEQAHRRVGRFEEFAGTWTRSRQWPRLAVRAQQSVSRGEQWPLGDLGLGVRDRRRLDGDVAQRRVERARAVAEDPCVLQWPFLPDRGVRGVEGPHQ